MEKILMQKFEKIREERAGKYGDFETNHTNIANAWHAILCSYYQQQLPPLPPHVACLMFSAFKHIRATIPMTHQEDDYDDATNYMNFARECDNKRNK